VNAARSIHEAVAAHVSTNAASLVVDGRAVSIADVSLEDGFRGDNLPLVVIEAPRLLEVRRTAEGVTMASWSLPVVAMTRAKEGGEEEFDGEIYLIGLLERIAVLMLDFEFAGLNGRAATNPGDIEDVGGNIMAGTLAINLEIMAC